MNWNLPTSVRIGEKDYKITNNCDYRVVLDVISALNDNDFDDTEKLDCALTLFYDDISECDDLDTAIKEMLKIIGGGEIDQNNAKSVRLMDWEYDFPKIAPAVSRIIGYDVRTPERFTHWYSFLGGYQEIGECLFSSIVSIRSKKKKGKKLEKYEEDFYRENRGIIDLPQKVTNEEKEILDSDW